MPLINGQKMACEPCIRGHRSTKCTHANERLMVPVRKPGRPLSSCPHPSSQPCACAAVTAAIPRKQKCQCGTSAGTPALKVQSDHESSPAPAATPSSPSKVGNARFRVNKQSTKTGSSRKQSVDVAGLHRMDSSQINIVPPYNARSPQTNSTTPMSDLSLYGSIAMTPGDGAHGAESSDYPMYSYAPESVMGSMCQAEPSLTMSGQTAVAKDGVVCSEPEPTGSCCGGDVGVNGTKSQARTTPVHIDVSEVASSRSRSGEDNNNNISSGSGSGSSSSGSSSRNNTDDNNTDDNTDIEPAAAGRCCSSTTSASTEQLKEHTLGVMPSPLDMSFAPGGFMMSPFQQPMTMANGVYPFYAQPNIFNYPPQYGSYMQPLQPGQWRYFMAVATAFDHNGGGGGGSAEGGVQSLGMRAEPFGTQQQMPTTSNGSSWTSYQCSCGSTCQCIGCAAHPYNEATQDYVRSAWNSMKEESHNGDAHSHSHTHGHRPHHNGVGGGTNAMSEEVDEATARPSSNGTTASQPRHDGPLSPAVAQSPSEAASGTSEEQALSASDFFFVSYPFADSCAGETMSCPCGDDCQCIGCAIHSNPGPMPMPMPSTQDETNL
ncbi:hypothetical protein E4U42_005212 [Claviceps africana]|uniref:Copper-fist domain-containing protein n=1 Tax=Claviceps africana TaxID=83212 RepID=A0A8K0NLC2_9HYPO|nr:hypothetical protein E4U42_005212 [Claviceps africana]